MFVVAAAVAAVASVAVNVDGWGIVSPLNAQVANIFVYILAEGEQGSVSRRGRELLQLARSQRIIHIARSQNCCTLTYPVNHEHTYIHMLSD